MGTIKDLGDKAFRDFVTDGVPSSGTNNPRKSEVREAFAEADRLVQAGLGGGGTTFNTLAQANANIGNIPENGGVNIVANGSNNGFYVKQGGVLVKKSDATLPALDQITQRVTFRFGAASGTANDVVLNDANYTPRDYVPGLMLSFIASATNTGPMTVTIGSLTIKDLVDMNNVALVAGTIKAGYLYTIQAITATRFRLIARDSELESLSPYRFYGERVTGTADAIVLTDSSRQPIKFAEGQITSFIPNAANTGAVTVQIGNLAARGLYDVNNQPLTAGFLQPGRVYIIQAYTTTRYLVISADRENQIAIDQEVSERSSLIQKSPYPGVVVANQSRFVIDYIESGESGGGSTDPDVFLADCMPYFGSEICGLQGQELSIFTSGLLEDRTKAPYAQISLHGINGLTATSNDEIRFFPEQIGDTAQLIARPRKWKGGSRLVRNITMRVAPVPAVAPVEKNILIVGDSISNRQGAFFLKQYLTAAGYLPNFIGTMRGSALAPTPTSGNGGNADGPLGECREGWESGDYTNAIIDRSFPIAPGDEASYLAMTKTQQRDYNPFIRLATSEDDAAIVRNGYVLDFGFYQTRFGLVVPDIILLALGTNDIRDRGADVVAGLVYENILLMINRMRAAWPNARIVVTIPGTSRDATRDGLWTEKYIPVIRSLMRAVSTANDNKVVLAPVWAMVNQDAGYTLTVSETDPVTGVQTAVPNDAIHPIDGNRSAIFRALAGYIACAMTA
ncbi:SGNH/GDSL hydrolase family protein [Brucella sp. C7-11G]